MDNVLRIGTRASPLARWQASRVLEALEGAGRSAELVDVSTTGDARLDIPLGGPAPPDLFTRELDEALREGRIACAVHSLKDIPTMLPEGIAIAAVLPRADPRDALVGRSSLRWSDLPHGATVATCSLRRRAQLLRARPDLAIEPIRGNVATRLARLDAHPDWSATILAVAGLARLGLEDRISDRLAESIMLPAPGQGAIAVTVRTDDRATAALLHRAAHDPDTGRDVGAERALLQRLEGGCQVPVGALARREPDGALTLTARVVALDGTRSVESVVALPEDPEAAMDAGRDLAERLLAEGGAAILDAIRSPA